MGRTWAKGLKETTLAIFAGDLFNVTGGPHRETLVAPAADTLASRAAGERLQAVLEEPHPVESAAR
jgi:hypothetical protein